MSDICELRDCPIGLFWHGEALCLKTEYGNNEGRIDAYIVESGEFFWGDAPQTIEGQRAQLVRPVASDIIETQAAHITRLTSDLTYVRNELYLNNVKQTWHLVKRIDATLEALHAQGGGKS